MKENNVVGSSIKGRRLVHEEQPDKCCWGESDRPRPERVNERQSQDVEYFSSFSSCETEMSSFHLAQLGLELYLPVSIHHSIYSLKGTNWLVQWITEHNYLHFDIIPIDWCNWLLKITTFWRVALSSGFPSCEHCCACQCLDSEKVFINHGPWLGVELDLAILHLRSEREQGVH